MHRELATNSGMRQERGNDNPQRLMHYVELGRTYAVMGKTADDLDRPFVPARKMMDHQYAGILPVSGGTCVIGFSFIAIIATEFDCFSDDATIAHCLSLMSCDGGR